MSRVGPLVLIAGGAVLAYTAIEDTPGGPLSAARDLIRGVTPTPGIQAVTSVNAAGLAVSNAVQASAAQTAGAVVSASVRGQKVVSDALTWVGVPYLLGGLTRNGIDCSGLVKVCYATVGVNLPHLATAIGALTTPVDRSQAAPGDIVLWGSPANYPHCAIVIDSQRCVAAWTYGVGVAIKNIDIKAVAGYGLPVIHRVKG